MSEPVLNTDRARTARERFIDVFREKSNLQAFMAAFTTETQTLENAFFSIFLGFSLDEAVGAQLNALGEIVGVARSGFSDERYRIRIRARVLLNLSSGTPNEILNIARQLGAEAPVYTPRYPAGFEIEIIGTPSAVSTDVVELVQEATPAGVASNTIYSLSPRAELFSFSSTFATVETSSVQGFSDVTQVSGGKFAGASENT